MKRVWLEDPINVPASPVREPGPEIVEAWGLGDCLEFLGIEGEALDELFECLSWQTIYDVLDDLRRQCRKEW